ncbi:Hypothetical glycosyl hydrolase family 15 [uncultured archaeon]|nr:Hypothetical glycosyl hydrolase family 15 [uncultured archaeon]
MEKNWGKKVIVFATILLFFKVSVTPGSNWSDPSAFNVYESQKGFIFGSYTHRSGEGGYITIDAVDLWVIPIVKPLQFLHYTVGQNITYFKDTAKTYFTSRFIIGYIDITTYTPPLLSGRLQKMSIAYSLTMKNPANRQYVAQHFDLLDCNRDAATNYGSEIKTYNPNIKIIGYADLIWVADWMEEWPVINTHENWFIHDIYGTTSDHRIWRNEGTYKGYYMNPSVMVNSWTDYFANTMCLEFLQDTPSADGVFLDDAYYWLDRGGVDPKVMHSDYGDTILRRTLTFSDWDQILLDNWNTLMLAHIHNVKTALNSVPSRNMIMPNAWIFPQFCEQITHIHTWEGFIHARWDSSSQPGGYDGSWDYGCVPINLLHEQAQLGNIIAVNSGCTIDSPNDERVKWMRYTIGCFLLAIGTDISKAYYSWMFFEQETTGSIINGYHPMMDTDFGQPVQNYKGDIQNSSLQVYAHPNPGVISGSTHNYYGGVFVREFQNYWVIVNICPSLSTAYDYSGILPDGQSFTVHAKEALFIAK